MLRDDYFLLMPDLRGNGNSSHLPGLPDRSNYSKRAMAADVVALADALELDTFYLCGHDRGGRVAYLGNRDGRSRTSGPRHPRGVPRVDRNGVAPLHALTPSPRRQA